MSVILKPTLNADVTALVLTANYGFTSDTNVLVAAQAVWTSTAAVFNLTLQYSLDNVSWTNFAAATSITNTSSNVMWDVQNSWKDAPYWRVNAARTSGTLDTLKVYFANIVRT